jgi:RNA polymerase sigma factor (sigma-70 family)
VDEAERRILLLVHRDTLRRFARKLASTDEDADDLMQELAVVVLAHGSVPPDPENFPSWCFGVARNVAMHRRRSLARARAREDEGGRDARGACSPEDLERAAIVRQRLALHLDGLDASALRLLRDRFVFEETPTEMAERMNVSAASIRMRVSRIVAALRASERKSTERSSIDRYARRASGN